MQETIQYWNSAHITWWERQEDEEPEHSLSLLGSYDKSEKDFWGKSGFANVIGEAAMSVVVQADEAVKVVTTLLNEPSCLAKGQAKY